MRPASSSFFDSRATAAAAARDARLARRTAVPLMRRSSHAFKAHMRHAHSLAFSLLHTHTGRQGKSERNKGQQIKAGKLIYRQNRREAGEEGRKASGVLQSVLSLSLFPSLFPPCLSLSRPHTRTDAGIRDTRSRAERRRRERERDRVAGGKQRRSDEGGSSSCVTECIDLFSHSLASPNSSIARCTLLVSSSPSTSPCNVS